MGSAAVETNGESSTSMLDESRYVDVDKILDRPGPWTAEEFVGGQQVKCHLFGAIEGSQLMYQAKYVLRRMVKVLVIGAGGLGCEILQNLALSKLPRPRVLGDGRAETMDQPALAIYM